MPYGLVGLDSTILKLVTALQVAPAVRTVS